MNKKIASIISWTFNAYFALGLTNFLIFYTQRESIPNWLFLFFLSIILPALQTLIFLKLKLITDLDITNRKERPLFHFIGLIPWILLLIISLYSISTIFFIYELELIFIYLALAIISIYWKISGHMIFNSLLAFYSLYFYFSWYLLIFWIVILPLIAISRVVLKKHTVKQVIGGTILGIGLSALLIL